MFGINEVYRTGFVVCVVLVLNIADIFFLDNVTISVLFHLNNLPMQFITSRDFSTAGPIEHYNIGLLSVKFVFPTRLSYREVPVFGTDCPCTVPCRGSTIYLLYISPLLKKNLLVSV